MDRLPLFEKLEPQAVELAARRVHKPGCTRCPLHHNSVNPCLRAEGKPGGLLVVSDYPGVEEDKQNMPFVGASGRFLRDQLKQFWDGPIAYDNALRCRVSQSFKLKGAMKHITKCRDYLRDTLIEAQPQRILAMGAVAIVGVTGRILPPLSVRRGYSFLSDGTPVFYMANPAHAVRNYFVKGRWIQDLKWACTADVKPRNGWWVEVRDKESADEARARLFDNPTWVTFDCETAGRMHDVGFRVTNLAIQRSRDDVVFMWDEDALADPYIFAVAKEVLETIPVSGWNVKYDMGSVSTLGIEVRNVFADPMLQRHQIDSNCKDLRLDTQNEVVGLGSAKREGLAEVNKMAKAMVKSVKKARKNPDQLGFADALAPVEEEDVEVSLLEEPDRRAAWEAFHDPLLSAFYASYPDVGAKTYAYAKISPSTRKLYNARDVFGTDCLTDYTQKFLANSDHMQWMWDEVYRPAVIGLTRLEREGMAVDKSAVIVLQMMLQENLDDLTSKLASYGKFDPANPKSVGKFLFGEKSKGGLGLPMMQDAKGNFGSTKADVLKLLEHHHAVVPLMLKYRELSTLQNRYARGMLPYICADGRVHSSFRIEGTDTGRISSEDPNMQNVPAKKGSKWAVLVRNCFIVPDGHTLIAFDYSQLELKVAALLSKDPVFRAAVAGKDIHRATAAMVYNKRPEDVTDDERTYCKRVVFGVLYGMEAYKLYKDLRLSSVQEAQQLIDKILGTYIVLKEWIAKSIAYTRKTGCSWTFWKGKPAYRRLLFDILSHDEKMRKHFEHAATNTPVQGSAAFYMNRGVFDVQEWIAANGVPAKTVNTVHDSLFLEVRNDAVRSVLDEVPLILCQHQDPAVPLRVDAKAGPRWGMLEDAA